MLVISAVGIGVGMYFLTMGVIFVIKTIVKKFNQNRKLNNAINYLEGQDPLFKLFRNDLAKRDYFKALVDQEVLAYKARGFFSKIKYHLSNVEWPSTTFVRDYFSKKKLDYKGEHLFQAKSAYVILKSATSREQYDVIKHKEFIKGFEKYEFSRASTKSAICKNSFFSGNGHVFKNVRVKEPTFQSVNSASKSCRVGR